MAESSTGFDTAAGIAEADFALLSPYLGSVFPVVGASGANAVKAGSTAMTVDVAAGASYCFGVRHNITTVTNLPIAAVTLSGAIRWDAVIKRFDWSNNSVTIMVVAGTAAVNATKTAPGGLNANPGVVYDQVLALVKATNGSTALEVSPRDISASKQFTVKSVDAIPTPTTAHRGSTFYVSDTKTLYRYDEPGGSPAFVAQSVGLTEVMGESVFRPNTDGWGLDSNASARCLMTGPYERQIDLQIRNFAGAINVSSVGNFPDTVMGWLQGVHIPDVQMPVHVSYLNGGTDCYGLGRITIADGAVWILAGQAGNNLSANSIVRVSLRFSTRKAAF